MATVDLGYQPRAYQDRAHRQRRQYTVLVWHRGSGKTEWALMELIHEACTLAPMPSDPRRLAYIAPLRVQAQDVVWDRLLALTAKIPGAEPNKAELRVRLPNGAIIQLYGADNPDRLRGITLDGCVLDEVAQMPPSLFTEVLLPALSRPHREGWCVWIGTPKGRNSFCEIYERTRDAMARGEPTAFADMQRASETAVIGEQALMRARAQMTPEEYDQEFECSFQAAIVGAYYGREMAQAEADGRITRVPYDPGAPVVTAWDLGYGDSTSIWIAQRTRMEVRILDHLEASGVGLDWYVRALQAKPYAYTETILPHDAGHGSIQTGRALVDTLRELGMPRCRVLEREGDIEHGIGEVRRLLPRCVFDAEKCARGIEALRQYRRDWDDRGQVFKPRPRHDWTSHAADAFRYLARGIGMRGDPVAEQRIAASLPRQAPAWDPFA